MSNILRKIFDRQQARVKEPTLPEQLREQALKQAEGFYSVSQFGMEHMSDGTFAVYPTGVQESPTASQKRATPPVSSSTWTKTTNRTP